LTERDRLLDSVGRLPRLARGRHDAIESIQRMAWRSEAVIQALVDLFRERVA